jgi:hypothetical protein
LRTKNIKQKIFDLLLWLGITLELKINLEAQGKQLNFVFPDDMPPDLSQPVVGCDWGEDDPKPIMTWVYDVENLTHTQIKEASAHLDEYARRYLESIKSEPPPLDLSNPDEAIVAFDNAIEAATTETKGES